jgi:hypothetical protein
VGVQNRVLGILGQKKEDREVHMILSSIFYRPAPCTIRLEFSRRMKVEMHVLYVGEKPNVYRVLVGKLKKVSTWNIWA